jgi:hypothetical protein
MSIHLSTHLERHIIRELVKRYEWLNPDQTRYLLEKTKDLLIASLGVIDREQIIPLLQSTLFLLFNVKSDK